MVITLLLLLTMFALLDQKWRILNDEMNATNNIEIGEWSIKQFTNQHLGELCLRYGLGHICNLRISLYREDKA